MYDKQGTRIRQFRRKRTKNRATETIQRIAKRDRGYTSIRNKIRIYTDATFLQMCYTYTELQMHAESQFGAVPIGIGNGRLERTIKACRMNAIRDGAQRAVHYCTQRTEPRRECATGTSQRRDTARIVSDVFQERVCISQMGVRFENMNVKLVSEPT